MKKIFYVLLVSCIGLTIIISCSSSSDEDDIEEIMTTDTTAATLAEVTAVTTPTNDSTPDYTFSSSEAKQFLFFKYYFRNFWKQHYHFSFFK